MSNEATEPLFRVWLAGYRDWSPDDLHDVPPTGIALRPLEPDCLTAAEASELVEDFNRQMLSEPKNVWAVPVRVQVVLRGEPAPGERIVCGAPSDRGLRGPR